MAESSTACAATSMGAEDVGGMAASRPSNARNAGIRGARGRHTRRTQWAMPIRETRHAADRLPDMVSRRTGSFRRRSAS